MDYSANVHICKHEEAGDNYVFVWGTKEERPWVRIKDSNLKGQKLILCSYCNSAAYILDHLFPYHSEMNMCREHYAQHKKGELDYGLLHQNDQQV